MELIDVYLQIDDEAYLEALAEGLASDGRDLRIFTSGAGCENAVTVTDRASDRGDVNFLYITEKEDDDPCHIFKYDDTRNISDRIREFYFARHGHADQGTPVPGARVIYFTSAEGGCGATSAAISSAVLLSRIYGYRSMYIDASETEGSEKFIRYSSGISPAELLFRLKFTSTPPVSEYVERGRYFDRLVMPFHELLSENDGPDILSKLISCLTSSRSYDYIIIDSNGISMLKSRKILDMVSCLILMCRHGLMTGCLSRLEERIASLRVPRVIKVSRSIMSHDNTAAAGAGGDACEHALEMSDSPSSFSDDSGKISIDLDGDYGDGIADLVMEIVDAGTIRRSDGILRRTAEVIH
jgi:hypothetical protein